MKKRCLAAFLTLAMAGGAGCATVTVRPEGSHKLSSSPVFVERQHFFLWGLYPDVVEVNVDKACLGRRVVQMQTQDTFLDAVLGVVTIGIYRPRTAKLWCE